MIPLALGAHSFTYFENPSSVPHFAIVSFRNLLPFFIFLLKLGKEKMIVCPFSYLLVTLVEHIIFEVH